MAEKRARHTFDGGAPGSAAKKLKSNAGKSKLPPVIHQTAQQQASQEDGAKLPNATEKPVIQSADGRERRMQRHQQQQQQQQQQQPSPRDDASATLKYLLQTLKDEESDDSDIRRYAGKLHKLLSQRQQSSGTDSLTAALNAKYPDTMPYTAVSPYRPSSPSFSGSPQNSDSNALPPLPPITDARYTTAPFTHASHSSSTELNYERLEFLGDAYIEIIATRLIFARFPALAPGAQAQIREQLVKNDTLASCAWRYDFSSRAVGASAVRDVKKVMADMFEAYVAAVILSDPADGFATAERWLTALWTPDLLAIDTSKLPGQGGAATGQDYKARLNSLLLAPGIKVDYREESPVKLDKKAGKYWYDIGVYLTGWGYENRFLGRGDGMSKVLAGAAAARDAWERSRDVIEDVRHKKELAYPPKGN